MLLNSLFILNVCYFNYIVSLSGNLWIESVWDFLYFLDLDVWFLSQIRDVSSYYVFKYVLCSFRALFFQDLYNANVSTLEVVSEFS